MRGREGFASEAPTPTNGLELEGKSVNVELLRVAKVQPLPIFRMMVTLRLVVRGSGREPQPQSPSSRLTAVHTQIAHEALGTSCELRQALSASIASARIQGGHGLAGVRRLNASTQV